MTEQKNKLPVDKAQHKTGKVQNILSLVLSLLAVLMLLAGLLPNVDIIYYPQTQIQQVEIQIKASPIFSEFNLSGNIPAGQESEELSGELSMPSSGKTLIPGAKAGGMVTFTNLTDTLVNIPEGTLLFTNDPQKIQFVTLESINLPDEKNTTADVRVEALQPGGVGNLPAGSITSISGSAGALVTITNNTDLVGGTDLETPSPDSEDYVVLKERLLDDLKNQALSSFQGNLPVGSQLIPSSLVVEKIIEEEQINEVGEPWDEARLQMTVLISVSTYQEADVNRITETILEINLPQGYQPLENSLVQRQTSEIELDDLNQAFWTVKAYRTLIPEWDEAKTSQILSGMKKADAIRFFEQLFPQSQPAVFKSFFNGWPLMPYLPTQIHFINGVTS